MPIGLTISVAIWQSYINAISDYLQGRKYYDAVMDDILLFTPNKKTYNAKLEYFLKTLIKKWIKNVLQNISAF